MKQYRAAIIGTGSSVGNHLNALRQFQDRVELVAAVDIEEARVKAFCEQNGVTRWYTNATDMLSATQPDLVCIVTPPGTHLDLTLESLRAGAWVNCEKPLCASLAQFDQIEKAEASTGRYVGTALQWRFGSGAKHLKRLIDAGEMGRPLVGVCHTLWYRTLAYYQVPWRGKWATETGGVTSTLGIHITDLFLWLMGDWQEIRAMLGTLDRLIEVEDVSMGIVKFENGAMGNITNTVLAPRQDTYLRLDFQRATVELTALYRGANADWHYSIADGSPDAEALPLWQTIEKDTPGSHAEVLVDFLDSMDRGERPLVSGLEARRVLEFNASLYKAAFTGLPVVRGSITLDDPFYYSMNGSLQTLEGA
jgi:predicted dehydrogenase